MDFQVIKRELKLTDGNLSSHLSRLESAGYIKETKEFVNKRPRSFYEITKVGKKKLQEIVREILVREEAVEKGEIEDLKAEVEHDDEVAGDQGDGD